MASLKETKNRITSVQNTLKITTAMKLISSAKFHQSQIAVRKVKNYDDKLNDVVQSIFEGREDIEFSFATERPVKKVALVPFSSDSGLCGSFNSAVLKVTEQIIDDFKKEGIDVVVYPVGNKITTAILKTKNSVKLDGSKLIDKPTLEKCRTFSSILMNDFINGDVDKVIFLFHRIKRATKQVLIEENILPFEIPAHKTVEPNDLLTEPGPLNFLETIFPQYMASKLYSAIFDSLVSEHASRMTAMQIATDNANELLKELTILYNKTRQQAITSEILDLVGGRIRRS
jgi:F-type H+-transporting ATPase subunit gamma